MESFPTGDVENGLVEPLMEAAGIEPARHSPRVAALFVDPNGVYSGLPHVDCWGEARDARLYAGPWPVVAHPPCQRWCRFAKGIEKQYPQYRVGDDGGCFEAALNAVHEFGGVLEHPADSLAWDHFDLPKPRSSRGWTESLFDYGVSCYVEQGRYGHPMRKATWLYSFGVSPLPVLLWGRRIDSELGEFKWGHRADKTERDRNRPRVDGLHSVTPPAFRDVLLGMARSVSLEVVANA